MSCRSSDPPDFCTDVSPELRLYQAFMFSIPVFFTFVLLFLFYLFYLRRRRANWASLGMGNSEQDEQEVARTSGSGIKKEVREMFPVVVFRESFSIRESRCSVCLGDYKTEDHLKRIPPCGHTFHVDCIDHWLATNTTCPLCRSSLVLTPRASLDPMNLERERDLEAQTNSQEVATESELLRCDEAGTANADEIEIAERSCTSNGEPVHGVKDPECRHDENQSAI